MVIALWVIAALLVVACYFLYLVLAALIRLISLTTIASDMNDENQRRVWSCVRRIHMVEHVLHGIREQGLSDEERLKAHFDDRSQEDSIFDNEKAAGQMKL